MTGGELYWFYLFVDEDTSIAQPLCQLLSQFGESFPRFIVKNLSRPDVLRLIEMVLAYTNFPGYFGVDEDLS